jgi:glycerophosphoryl diester phosphodiesterase
MIKKILNERLTGNCKLLRIAHRGFVPENKILGFKEAITRGCDIIECDIRLSADKHPMIIHDKTINRTTNGVGHVKYLSRNDLEYYSIPSLEQMIQWFNILETDVCVAFEIKDIGTVSSNKILLDKTLSLLQKHDMINRSIIISFNPKIVQDAKVMCPEIVTGFIYGNMKTILRNPFCIVKQTNADILWAHHKMIKPLLHLNKDNLPICVWTVNKKSDITCLDKNIIGIVSDDIQNIFKD